MGIRPNSPAARDIAYNFHPYTNARLHEERGPMIIDKAEGIHVWDDQGKQYIEGLAGLWCVSLGWGNKRLIKAATQQMERMAYYHSFAHKSHEPSIDLSERLIEMAPGGRLKKVFYGNSGSEANDTAVKLVWYYNNARGKPEKKKIIARLRGYHGITVASGSLTGLPANHRDFDLPIKNILHTGCPHHYRNAQPGESEEDFATRLAEELEQMILAEGPETVAAFVGEPVMGAGGVIVPPETYWPKMQAVCRKYDVLVWADEVINGFGRTGKMFGCETYGIEPDIMVIAKQLSSAYLPISATLFSDEIYQACADNTAKIGTFGHGFTYSGHPASVAVALETLKIYEEMDVVSHAQAISPVLQDGIRQFQDNPLVGEVRGVGLIGAVELVADKETKAPFDPLGKVGGHLFERCQDHGLIIRNLGDTLAFCPPLIIEKPQLEQIIERFGKALADTTDWASREGLLAH